MRASKSVIVSCEELVSPDVIRADPDRTTIPYLYVDAVVVQPWGAYPTAAHRYYEHDAAHIAGYQRAARVGGPQYEEYLDTYVRGCSTFDEFLEKAAGEDRLEELRKAMEAVL